MIEQKVSDRLGKLISEYPHLMAVNEYGVSTAQAECLAWVAAADQVVALVLTDGPYRNAIDRAIATIQKTYPHRTVEIVAHTLARLAADIGDGLITSIQNEIRAETFDDLLDHAESYLREGRKEPSGAIAGVVFEDTIRRLCRANGIDADGGTCDPLINALTSNGVLTKLESKEAKAAAGLRTSATHALWDEFKDDQVTTVINFTRRIIREKFAG